MSAKLRNLVMSVAGVATVLFTSSLVSPPTDGRRELVQDGARLAAALELKLQNLRSLPLPGPAALGKLARATAAEREDFLDAGLFAAERDGEPALRIACLPVGGTEAGSVAVMALTEQMGFVRAAVVDRNGKLIGEWQHFMEDLKWYDVPRLEGALPRSQLAKLREKAEGEDDEDASLVVGLLSLLQHMNQQASVFNLPRESQPFTFGEGARMMSEEYRKVAELAPALAPILGNSSGEFVRIARDSSDAASELAKAFEEMDQVSGRAAQRRVMGNCKSCHELALSGFDGGLNESASQIRKRLGIGDGFYQIGHDMRIRHPDRDRAQLVADALRRGALLVDASLSSSK